MYIYDNRSAAAAACNSQLGLPLCSKAQLLGYSSCAYGWCSDYQGYWMSSAVPGCGNAGYNDGSGQPSGAYCCFNGTTPVTPCPTCYFANAALPVVQAGVDCFVKTLGVPASKLVLAFPWYAYDYTCSTAGTPFGNLNSCDVTNSVQVDYPRVQQLLAAPGTVTGWNANASTPYLGYHDDSTGTLHRVDYDNSTSLRAKYSLAKDVGAWGVGMWTASGLNYSDFATAEQFWDDLKVFRPGGEGGASTLTRQQP